MTTVDSQVTASGRFLPKAGALAGLVFFLLYFVATAMLLGPISQTDSQATVAKTFNDQADNIDVAASLVVLSIPFLLCFVVTLRATLMRAEGGAGHISALAGASATGGAALLIAGAALMGGTSFLAEYAPADAAIAAFSHSAAEACIFYSLVFFGVVALATAVITIRHGALPKWFGWLAAVLGLAMVLGSAGSPLVRSLAFLAAMSMNVFFLVGSFVVFSRAGGTSGKDLLPKEI